MSVTISDGTTILYPALITGWESVREGKNVVHTIIEREDPDVTLRAAAYRSGTLELLCATLADALALEVLHAQDKAFTVDDTDATALAMTYVVSGAVRVAIDDETRDRWVVSVDFQQVEP